MNRIAVEEGEEQQFRQFGMEGEFDGIASTDKIQIGVPGSYPFEEALASSDGWFQNTGRFICRKHKSRASGTEYL